MASKHYYLVGFFNEAFASLEDAKWNVKVGFTPRESLKYLSDDEKIYHYIGDKLHSITPINVDDAGRVSFGRTKLV